VEALTVTENGRYAEEGKAYNPVFVEVPAPAPGEWVRPSDWPDIDALANQEDGERDCLYLTYDLRKTEGYGWIGLYGKTADATAWTVERGHISGGAFVADETHSVNSNAKFRQTLDDTDGDVQLWRVTSAGHLTEFGFVTNSATTSEAFQNMLQPCVQRAGYLPWRSVAPINIGYYDSQICNSTTWLERDAAAFGTKVAVTSLRAHWSNCYNLQSVDVSRWDTSLWAVTNIQDMCLDCTSLREIDFSGLDVSGWNLASASSTFSTCGVLHTIKGFGRIETAASINHVNFLQGNYDLQTFDGFRFRTSTNIAICMDLTPDSLVAILTALPEVSTSQTLTLWQANKLKLSAAQIAIATGKGWTVA
jgi:hypothetical protein